MHPHIQPGQGHAHRQRHRQPSRPFPGQLPPPADGGGKGGGYRLCKSPDQFTAGQILRLMEGSLAPVACLEAGSSPCDRAGECRTLSLWAGLNDVINKYLDQYTLADMLREDGDYDYVI